MNKEMASLGRAQNNRISSWFTRNWRLYTLLLPGFVWLILFCCVPMYGVLIAFKNFNPSLGILKSEWVGLKYFTQYLSTGYAYTTIYNTVILSLMQLAIGFPVPIIFALLLNQVNNPKVKKVIQTTSFAPHFISVVVLVSTMNIFLQPNGGFIQNIIRSLNGGKAVLVTTRPEYFRGLYTVSGIWQSLGYNAIVYIAALTSIDPQLHEAAVVDGATKIQRILHIDIPSILPIIVTMFILSVGRVMSVGYEKVYLMQNTMNLSVSEVISTYVYKMGLLNAQFSFSTAVNLFNSVVNLVLLVSFNWISKRVTSIGIF